MLAFLWKKGVKGIFLFVCGVVRVFFVACVFLFCLCCLWKKSAFPVICEREESAVLTDPVSGVNKRPNCW